MAISTHSDNNPTIGSIVKRGFQKAGLLRLGGTVPANQAADCRDLLEDKFKELQSKGVILATEERAQLALVSGTTSYTLPADTIDIDGDGMVSTSGTTNRTPVRYIPFADYNRLSNLTVTGLPTQMYVEKTSDVKVLFWPVPNAAMTMDYRRIRMLRDVETDGVNADLWRRGLNYLSDVVAVFVGSNGNVPLNKLVWLQSVEQGSERVLFGDTHEKGDLSFHFDCYRR